MKHAVITLAATASVGVAKIQPGCDWIGTILISGDKDKNNYQDFYLTCTDNLLASISGPGVYAKNSGLMKETDGDVSDVACDWSGPGRINGINTCDDFNFECYAGTLYGIKTIESVDTGCTSLDLSPFGSSSDGVVCNFATSMRTSGLNGVDFSFDCQNGTIDYIYYDTSNFVEKVHDAPKDTDSPTCTTWATATGSWQLLHEHNEDFTYEFTYGTSSTDTDSTTSTWSASLQESISAGCFFIEDTVTANVSKSISETVASSLTYDYVETTTVPCSSPNGNNEGGALYQWIMNTQHVDETSTTTTIFSDTTICVAYEGEPKCPVDACSDKLCQTCNTWISTSNVTDPGYQIAACNWGSPIVMTDGKADTFTFACNSDKMDGIAGYTPDPSDSLNLPVNSSSDQVISDSVTACASCDWTGYKSWYGPENSDDCDASIIECYNGFIYSITFVGEIGKYHASNCRGLNKPYDTPLAGTLCNWDGDYIVQDNSYLSNLHLTCNAGILSTYQYTS